MNKIEYKNNTSATPNRRRLKILDNTNPLDMVVEIQHLDGSKNGNLIDADLLQRLEDNLYELSQKVNALEEENNAQSNLPQTGNSNGNSPKIYVNGEITNELSFDSNPQTQIGEIKNLVNSCNTNASLVKDNYNNIVTNINEMRNQVQESLNSLSSFKANLQNEFNSQIADLRKSAIVFDENGSALIGNWKFTIDSSGDLQFDYLGV